ncbi:hypothetical protein HK102_008683 [Quaeritorhiza haematococci]|nr:hypothetical protein HK102_008683 [Quaeritorhiza haematococci]
MRSASSPHLKGSNKREVPRWERVDNGGGGGGGGGMTRKEEGIRKVKSMDMDHLATTSPATTSRTHSTTSLHSSAEYKVALALELWKQSEETKFHTHLRQRETEHLQRLALEWQNREAERDLLFKRKSAELQDLERQVQKMVVDLEERERKILRGEEDLVRRREDLEREHERRVEEARDATRRLHEEYKHRMEVEKRRASEALESRSKALAERDDLEVRRKALESEISELRRVLNQDRAPELALRARVDALTAENAVLEKKVEAAVKGKKHYKEQWVKVLKELARVKKTGVVEMEERLAKSLRELEVLRGRYLAKESTGVREDEERRVVEAVRRELEDLRVRGGGGVSKAGVMEDVTNRIKGEGNIGNRNSTSKPSKPFYEPVKDHPIVFTDESRFDLPNRDNDHDQPNLPKQHPQQNHMAPEKTTKTDDLAPLPSDPPSPSVPPHQSLYSKAPTTTKSARPNNLENFDPRVVAEIERMTRERDSLIESGAYTREDGLIKELERRIGEVIRTGRVG